MYRWALVRTGDEDDAEDATQEALVRLFRGLGKFGGKAHFETWLFSVVRSAVADVQRNRARILRLKSRYSVYGTQRVTAEPAPVEADLDRRHVGELVRKFLSELPARQREAMDLVDLQQVSQADAARMLGVSPGTLRTHLFRARRAMRSRLLETSPAIAETE